MDSSRQLLLGTLVFLGGGTLLFAMVNQMGTPSNSQVEQTPVAQVSTDKSTAQSPMTADVATEERILAQKRLEREKKMSELDQRTREFLTEQEKAEALAMQKARLENEQYRNNSAAEPVTDGSPADEAGSEVTVTKPVVKARPVETVVAQVTPTPATQTQATSATQTNTAKAQDSSKPEPKKVATQQAPSSTQKHTVQRGEGLIKLARQYNVPVEAISQANKLSHNASIRVGQTLTIPSRSQVDRLVSEYNASSNKSAAAPTKAAVTSKPVVTSTGPTSQKGHEVKAGEGLIKLARQYNVPVEALAEANNMSTNTSLKVGQTVTIPSRKQVERLQREAQQKQAAEQKKREAQQRLADARRKAASGEAKGTFGVQVALADNQKKADDIVKQLRAAGYRATTSNTSKGVRVIVGPEKGKEAALALKDKINADSRTDVDNAWVLYWR